MKIFIFFLLFIHSSLWAGQLDPQLQSLQFLLHFNEGKGIQVEDYSLNKSSVGAKIETTLPIWVTSEHGYRLDLNGGWLVLSTAVASQRMMPAAYFSIFIRFKLNSFPAGVNTLFNHQISGDVEKILIHFFNSGNVWGGFSVDDANCTAIVNGTLGTDAFLQVGRVYDMWIIFNSTKGYFNTHRLEIISREPFSTDWRRREWRTNITITDATKGICNKQGQHLYTNIGADNSAGVTPCDVELEEFAWFDAALPPQKYKAYADMLSTKRGQRRSE